MGAERFLAEIAVRITLGGKQGQAEATMRDGMAMASPPVLPSPPFRANSIK